MKKIILRVMMMALFALNSLFTASAQTPKSVLDKAAATITVKEGVKANFKMTAGEGSTSGTLLLKGRKFHASTPVAIVWFDGKTQWTYVKNNDEVNISTPTEAQLQAINPYNFINLYKKGYDATLNKSGKDYVVHLTATDKNKKIQELFVTVNKSTYHPTQVKLLQNKKWTVFDITDIKRQNIPDSQFQFNSKDFPNAEIIDLR
jgi:outer membrane lipoprotein-sorting protein